MCWLIHSLLGGLHRTADYQCLGTQGSAGDQAALYLWCRVDRRPGPAACPLSIAVGSGTRCEYRVGPGHAACPLSIAVGSDTRCEYRVRTCNGRRKATPRCVAANATRSFGSSHTAELCSLLVTAQAQGQQLKNLVVLLLPESLDSGFGVAM